MSARRENRFHVCLSDEEITAIDEWRFAHRIATRADAVRRIISAGLPKLKEQTLRVHVNGRAARKEAELPPAPMPERAP